MDRRFFLIGAASALTAAATAAAPPPHEQTRIDRLIRFVENHQDMTFVRNGTDYTCAEAARFLRGKLESMGDDVKTARDFIERIASKSSMSGEPYRVKFADGKILLASQFLGDELKRMDREPA